MRKSLLLLLLTVPLFAQIEGPTPVLIGSPPGGEGGSCTAPVPMYADLINGFLYACQSGVWTKLGSGGGGATAFSAITTGVNTTATMTVGTGATLTFSGTGTINANKLDGTLLSSLSTGILKVTTSSGAISIAGSSDIIGLFTGCSGVMYLGADGACHSAAGSGLPVQTAHAGQALFTDGTTAYWSAAVPYDVTACGVTGDGITDDTAALNTCITNMPDYGVLVIPYPFKIKVTSTINIHNKYGFRIKGDSSHYGGGTNTDMPLIFWAGADGGTVLDILDSENGLLDHFTILSAPGSDTTDTGAGTLINVDQSASPSKITTDITLDYMALVGLRQRVTFDAIVFSAIAQSNVEHMMVTNSLIECSNLGPTGNGIRIGPSFNAIGSVFSHNSIVICDRGIYEQSGSAHIVDNQFNLNRVHIEAYPDIPVNIEGNDSENCNWNQAGGVHTGAWLIGSGNLRIASNRIASCNPGGGNGPIRIASGNILFENNAFGPFDEPGIQGGAGGGDPKAVNVISRNNIYPTANTGSAATFLTAVTALGMFTSSNDSYTTNGSDTATIPLAAAPSNGPNTYESTIGKIYYRTSDNLWKLIQKGPSGAGAAYDHNLGTYVGGIAGCSDAGGSLRTGDWWASDDATSIVGICGKVGGTNQYLYPTIPLVLTRALPTTVNNTINLGTFQANNIAATYFITVNWVNAGLSTPDVSKYYMFSTEGTVFSPLDWEVVVPYNHGPNAATGNDYNLELFQSGVNTNLRLRRTVGSATGDAVVTIVAYQTTAFTSSSTVNTGVTAAPFVKQDTTITQGQNLTYLTGASGFVATIDTSLLTANHLFKLPNGDGILGLSDHHMGGSFGTPGGTTLTTGLVSYTLPAPVACKITGYDIMVDTGTTTLKFWKVNASTLNLPTSGNSISTSGVSISSGQVLTSNTTSDFTTLVINVGDVVAMTDTAVSGAGWIQAGLRCQ